MFKLDCNILKLLLLGKHFYLVWNHKFTWFYIVDMKKCLYSYFIHGHVVMMQEYGYVYNVRRYGRTISSSAPNHVARADQLDADTGDISRQILVLPISWFFTLQYLVFTELPSLANAFRIPQWQTKRSPFFQKSAEQVRFELGMLLLNSECSWCRALRGRGVRRLRVRGDSHGRRQVLLPPQEAAGLGQVRTKTNSKVVFAQEWNSNYRFINRSKGSISSSSTYIYGPNGQNLSRKAGET